MITKRSFFYLLLFSIFLSSVVYGQEKREKIKLDFDWRFHLGSASDPYQDFNYGLKTLFAKSGVGQDTPISVDFPDSSWQKIDLPHDWAVGLPYVNDPDLKDFGYKPVGRKYPESSVGWYRKHFKIERVDPQSNYQIEFEGLFNDADIWINGFYLDRIKSGYTGSSGNVTDFLFDEGVDNVITVRVDATQHEGWYYEGAGIYRHVWLHKFSKINIEPRDYFFYAKKIAEQEADLEIRFLINNDGENRKVTAHSYVTNRDGDLVGETKSTTLSIEKQSRHEANQSLVLKNPRLWSTEDPYLYNLTTAIFDEKGKEVDLIKQKIGIRSFQFDADSGFYLNGERVKIKGVNIHQDFADLGLALPDDVVYHRIKLLKQMGTNAIRTSHNPPSKTFLEACDSLGILVIDETRHLSSGNEFLKQFEEMIKRDRNHPSVMLWSIGNEEGIQRSELGKRIALTMLDRQKSLDPTRISTYGADVANVGTGINEVIPVRGFNYREFGGADYHRDHPEQPLLGTEMASTFATRGFYKIDSVRGYLPDHDSVAPWWGSKSETWWKLIAENPYWAGGFIWSGFDYRGEPTPFRWPNINSHFGVMDMYGFPKSNYYYYKSWWTDENVLQISPHWNWKESYGKKINVWVNSNAEKVELFLNDHSLGEKIMPKNGHLEWNVPYSPGELKAVGEKEGRKFSTKIETTGRPFRLTLEPSTTTFLANGEDVSILNIRALDEHYREVPDADNRLYIEISGPGKIISLGNGDPSSLVVNEYNDGVYELSLFSGVAQMMVQSTRDTGSIKINVRAKGLYSAGTEIFAASPSKMEEVIEDKKYEWKSEYNIKEDITPMLGADISFLPQLEEEGMNFYDQGEKHDALDILKNHGLNYIRLRLFVDPGNEKGYSPGKGYCGLEQTLEMATRVKDAGLNLLLDFHYSDTWADPGKQFIPERWKNLSYEQLRDSVYGYTKMVLEKLRNQGTLPDMVQVGNEINHGFLWPMGNIKNPNGMAGLFRAGAAAVKEVDQNIPVMFHLALGGQNTESVLVLMQMFKRGVDFDILGLSYYPQWHGTLSDLESNLKDLSKRFEKDIIIVEYSAKKETVNRLGFTATDRMKGTCIWEPLNFWERLFGDNGEVNSLISIYDETREKYFTE